MVLLSVTILPNSTSLPKKHSIDKSQQIFVHDVVEIVDSCSVLGSVISTETNFLEKFLKQQKSLLRKLAVHANFSPQNIYKTFTPSVRHKLSFLVCTTLKLKTC